MVKHKYSKKIRLTAEEISSISITLRESVRRAKQELKKAKAQDLEGIREHLVNTGKLQKRFQRLAVKIEKEVIQDIKGSREEEV